jgi:hypothetical protein
VRPGAAYGTERGAGDSGPDQRALMGGRVVLTEVKLLPKVKVEVVACAEADDRVVEAIAQAARRQDRRWKGLGQRSFQRSSHPHGRDERGGHRGLGAMRRERRAKALFRA